ncbi:MAG: hypothetical protein FWE62_06950, partial [Firmicutes bacterium]|nr:hypothetical protein [Bacillota bacterium]
MKIQEALKKYYHKLMVEGVVKSAVTGLFFGLIAAGLLSALALMFQFNGLWTVWVAAFLGLAVGAIAGGLSFTYKFKPSFHDAATRVDQTGLEERTLTMLELEDSETFIAHKQREDGQEKISKLQPKAMRLKFPAYLFVGIALAAAFGLTVVPTAAAIAINAAAVERENYKTSQKEDAIIRQLLNSLRAVIRGSNVSSDFKQVLFAEVDAIEARVNQAPTYVQKLDIIREGIAKILKMIEDYIRDIDTILQNPDLPDDDRQYWQGERDGAEDLGN